MKPIINPDTSNEDPKYWEEVLRSFNLGMRRAESKWLSYGQDWERDDESQLEQGDGKHVRPKKTLSQIERDGFGT